MRKKKVNDGPQRSHTVCPYFATGRIGVILVGVGGNGCRVLHGLAQLHLAMKALGHRYGLSVTSYDADVVSAANIGRTVFSASDIGQYKATVLTQRINCAYDLDWTAVPKKIDGQSAFSGCDILISCVDSAKARRDIHSVLKETAGFNPPKYWLDLGNMQTTGQVILGEPDLGSYSRSHGFGVDHVFPRTKKSDAAYPPRLPCVTDMFPELLDDKLPEDDRPSCSLQEAIAGQDLFINAHVSTWALQLLWELCRNATIERHGYFINLETGNARPLTVESSMKICAGTKG